MFAENVNVKKVFFKSSIYFMALGCAREPT